MIDEEARDAILKILENEERHAKLSNTMADRVVALTERVAELERRQPSSTAPPDILARAEAVRKAAFDREANR